MDLLGVATLMESDPDGVFDSTADSSEGGMRTTRAMYVTCTTALRGLLRMQDELVSRISRKSINLLKEHFAEDMSKDEWRLVIKLKKVFNID